MANTRDVIGDQATVDGMVSRTLTSLEENGVSSIPQYALYQNEGLTNVRFPNLTQIGGSSFSSCTSLTDMDSTTFPSVTTIGSSAFSRCYSLINAIFPLEVIIGTDAFNTCRVLQTVDIGGGSLSLRAFENCGKLKSIIIRGNEICSISNSNAFNYTPIAEFEGAIYVPTNLVNDYRQHNIWKNFIIASIEDYPLVDFSTINDSWSDIFANESNGTYSTKYKIGDTKMLDLGSGGKLCMQIVAFDTDDRADGNGKAKITWLSKVLLDTKYKINESSKNIDGVNGFAAGGWESSDLRNFLRTTIKSLMPETVRNAIIPVTKIQSVQTASGLAKDGQTTTDDIWIPSAREVLNNTTYETTGNVYSSYFFGSAKRIKKRWGEASAEWWILRTVANANSFVGINTSGTSGQINGGSDARILLGFCT